MLKVSAQLMMQRVANGSRAFAYVYVRQSADLIGSVALMAKVNQCEFLSGKCFCVMWFILFF